jgi:hypothetical protein
MNELTKVLLDIARTPGLCENCLHAPRETQLDGQWLCIECADEIEEENRDYDPINDEPNDAWPGEE